MTDPSAQIFRWIDSPLIIATTASHGQLAGCVAGFHTQCSIEPVRYAVWLSKANHTQRVALFSTHVALHFLDKGDHDLAALFGGLSADEVDKFASVAWSAGPGGVPLIDACPNRIVLRRTTVWDDGSDHVCLIGEPIDAQAGPLDRAPMRVTDADDIEPGHSAGSRGTPNDLTAGESAEQNVATLEDIAAGSGHPIDLPGGH
ncbi:MAG: flavin reductase domain protein FMN-binding protein [Acidimicrobiales bacterium]|nr:flavin reductase domain protein FMN-binding protein [Acidimicrobiales bacterium]